MKNSDLQELINMCDEALEAIEQQYGRPRGTTNNDLFKKIRAVGDACLNGNDINSELNERIPIKLRYDFKTAVFQTARLDMLGGDKNQYVKNNLSAIKSTIQNIVINKKNDLRIFYSWQATLPNRTNRSFIKTSIERALKELNKEFSLETSLDSDTTNVAGSPDIINTILEKIDNSDVFIADVSIVNGSIPNPNVMFELGYAMKALGGGKIIMIFNEAYGSTRDLPFDLGFKRQMLYNVTDNSEDISEKRIELGKRLANAIAEINKSQS